jgi:hypothetical protein
VARPYTNASTADSTSPSHHYGRPAYTVGTQPVAEQQPDPLQDTRTVGDHCGRVGQSAGSDRRFGRTAPRDSEVVTIEFDPRTLASVSTLERC